MIGRADVTALDALDRTARLINDDFFDGQLELDEIVAGLTRTTVRIVAVASDLQSPNGQTAVVTATKLIGMLGIGIDLAIPAVAIQGSQPPLRGDELREALIAHGRACIPGTRIAHRLDAPADLIVLIGTAQDASTSRAPAISMSGDATRSYVGPADRTTRRDWPGDWPFGALAGAVAAAGEAFRIAIAQIAARANRPYPSMCRPPARDVVELTVGTRQLDHVNLGAVEAVSAGAITTAVMYTLLRVPALRAQLRCFDDDQLEPSNLNRYSLMALCDIGLDKTALLVGLKQPGLDIAGIARRFDAGTADTAPRIIVGADDIPSAG
jgi:hypothetical protein